MESQVYTVITQMSVTVRNVSSEDFDIPIMLCLLRNMPPCVSAPITGWDTLPLPNDTSTGADLARVKWYKNVLTHNPNGKLSNTDFVQFWGGLEGVSIQIMKTIGNNYINKWTYG